MDRKKRILLVEDDSGSRKLMSLILSRAGYETVSVTNAVEALERARAAEPMDLVIMDLELPGLPAGR
jgi:CheY-like chemotaxis protein